MKNKSNRQKVFIHILLIGGAVLTLVPFLWMVLTSLKTMTEAVQVPPIIFPERFRWENYEKALSILPFGKFYYNTIVSTAWRTIGQILFCSMAAYAFARIEFPAKETIFLILLSVLMVPGQIFLIPQYLIISKIGLLNTVTALVLPGLFSAFGTFLLRQFFMTFPKSLEEAAILDGCNHFRIYWNVMMPLAVPGLVALAIFTILAGWNDLMWPLIVNTSMDKMTLSAGLASLQGQHLTDYPVLMAGAIAAIWPMILIFILFQRSFVEGIAITGTKG
ncbi:MAG: carbohydrate ABC transporter permease [Firmicutes bacterium]|nr:carbohydrate ABC transporter permease [Bacillota bacterium]